MIQDSKLPMSPRLTGSLVMPPTTEADGPDLSSAQFLEVRGVSMPASLADIGSPAHVHVHGGGGDADMRAAFSRSRSSMRLSQLQAHKVSFDRSGMQSGHVRGCDPGNMHISQRASEDGWNLNLREVCPTPCPTAHISTVIMSLLS